MKIATWNLQRQVTAGRRTSPIIECLTKVDADILILTETNKTIRLGDEYGYYHTATSKSIENYPEKSRLCCIIHW